MVAENGEGGEWGEGRGGGHTIFGDGIGVTLFEPGPVDSTATATAPSQTSAWSSLPHMGVTNHLKAQCSHLPQEFVKEHVLEQLDFQSLVVFLSLLELIILSFPLGPFLQAQSRSHLLITS